MSSELDDFETTISAFSAELAAREGGVSVTRIDTHISTVLLAGPHAYKLKKPVDFGFVDFSTLAHRRRFCVRELELNRRFAPALYESLEAITDDAGEVVEYAVRMRRFDTAQSLDRLVADGRIDGDEIAAFAGRFAEVHAAQAPATPYTSFGNADLASTQIRACAGPPVAPHMPPALLDRLECVLQERRDALDTRKRDGHVRDCHGDLHLTNVVRFEGALCAFDCLEFNDALRVIDTMSDAAFLLMDLDHYGASALGHRFFNAYLQHSGDIEGLTVLPLYLAYRSLVRAKVALLAAEQDAGTRARAEAHLALADRYLQARDGVGLVITQGLSGSGKSHAARSLAGDHGFLHLRSDIERRRLSNLALEAPSGSALGSGLYTGALNDRTYAELARRARAALQAGYSVVVDAAFLERRRREAFFELACELGVPFHILACSAPVEELRRRIEQRQRDGDDASEATVAVLDAQLASHEALDATETRHAVTVAALHQPAEVAALGRTRDGMS